ncbi:proprotein convertase subtilisin/kexin type 5-like [Ruditapes philippinarum]|uniref:proprotein convertase subtilisin/kexin type 5-like n=1 Tax=Ruditapes philippinarum TaxID=129788 RepID=UPI00295AD77C|nr:proprotein convertase subtilisin/kexin type 5-like [Ruditapes philippinarum]
MLLSIKALLSLLVIFRSILCDMKCDDVDICPKYKPYCSKVGCVFECPGQFYINGTNCVLSCGDWYIHDQKCVQQCPETWLVKELLTLHNGQEYMEKKCVENCSTFEYVFNNTCVEACPLEFPYVNNRNCSAHCSDEKHLLQNFSINSLTYFKCVSVCPRLVNDIYCTDKCVEKLVLNSTCVEKCPEAFPFISERKCVETCPDTTVYIDKDVCLQNCSKETPFFNNQTCLKTCPESFYTTNRNGIIFCEDKCRNGEYTYKNTCLNSCADDGKRNYYLFYLNKTCQEKCPSDYLEQKEDYNYIGNCCPKGNAALKVNEGIKCVDKCPPKYVRFNDTCLSICPKYTYNYNDSRCVCECPKSAPLGLRDEKWRCIKSCSESYKTFKNGSCIYESDCDEPYFIFGTSCILSCPDGYFWLQTCIKRWDTPDTTIIATLLGVWVVLLMWSRTALKEYFIVLSMILFKTDESYKKHMDESIDDENAETTVDDRQPLVTQDNETEEV